MRKHSGGNQLLVLLLCATSWSVLLPTRSAARISDVLPSPTASQEMQVIGIPPQGHLYHAVYPGGVSGDEDDITPDGLRTYEHLVGKAVAWVYFSNNWFKSRAFPVKTASWIREAGSVPYIRLMLRSDTSQNHAEPTFTLARILNGDFDQDLRAWADAARDFRTPLIAEYGTEVNGRWFSWNGLWNGAGTLAGYGNPSLPDGPERFIAAYRHIIGLCRAEGATNIRWVFHVNNDDDPVASWNRLEAYYPGDDWVDWIGVSVYGAQTPMEQEWPTFRALMDQVYPRLTALSTTKPIVLLEFGVTSGNPLGAQARWARAALTDLIRVRWPRLIGFSWWNEAWPNDDNPSHNSEMRLQGNPALAKTFRSLIQNQENVWGTPIIQAIN